MTAVSAVLLQDTGTGSGNTLLAAMSGTFLIVWLAIVVICIIGIWKVFAKAGQPGWASLVPFYNAYIMLKIAGRPGWWLVLFLIPLVNIVIGLIVAIDIAKSFGQSAVFGVILLFFLSGIGYLILGFGSYRYVGPAAATATA
jgi:hypothetical protein